MTEASKRFGWKHSASRAVAMVLAGVGALGVVLAVAWLVWALVGQSSLTDDDASSAVKLGFIGLCLGAVGLVMLSLVDVLGKLEGHALRIRDHVMAMSDAATLREPMLEEIGENLQISDVAKAITHRKKERDALRGAIFEEIRDQDWEAAYSLVDIMEQRYGYAAEAKRLRQEVDVSRDQTIEQTVQAALERIDALLAKAQWDQARSESRRLMDLFPSNERIQRLPEDLDRHRQKHKKQLLAAWDQAVQRNDVDDSIDILKQLDQYLTPSEAAALEESARGVFRAKLQNLGVQFSMAVTDKRWLESVEIGEGIVREFPNSLMAKEVTASMPVLLRRARRLERSRRSSRAARDE
jgi:hypothetical protein